MTAHKSLLSTQYYNKSNTTKNQYLNFENYTLIRQRPSLGH